MIDPLVCVLLYLGRSSANVFCTFFQESLFGDAGHSLYSPVFVAEMSCPVHIIKGLSTLDNIFALKLVVEKCIQTVHVLVVETEGIKLM